MRDVTDNVTGELEVMVKRGRGRPRKEGALTNAQRQAAYRARRRESVTVTKNVPVSRLVVDQVDAYDECRLEVEQLRAQLAEALETIEQMMAEAGVMCHQVESLQGEVKREVQRSTRKDFELGKVREEYAQLEKSVMVVKSASPSDNANADVVEVLLSLLEIACKRKPVAGRNLLSGSEVWKGFDGVGLPDSLWRRLSCAVYGTDSEGKAVTGKTVTKNRA